MDKMIIRSLTLTIAFSFLVFAPGVVRAQSPLMSTQIIVGAPAQANLGEPFTAQALLADGQGHPIPKAVVYFTAPATFLGVTGNVVLAQAVTNANGQATAQIVDDFSGTTTLQAEFKGDTQYAPSNATTQISSADDQQVYVDHIGVDIPGFNVPPFGVPVASAQSPQQGIIGFIQNLWPAMNGWPVALVLLLVWSNYFFAVTFVFRVAKLGNDAEETASTNSRRLS